ncbi:MAG: helix-turn-helix domain-containing protein [Clostridia bacterium]|nr:helix-turn-helix domain-containing protein [Clostridia bacterium]
MTQLELAEKLSYSDKSVSKWEQGNGIPDVRILMQIAELFGVTLDDLVHVQKERKLMPKTMRLVRRTVVMTCSALLVWFIAVVAFVPLKLAAPELGFTWLSFVYAVPVSSVVVLVLACVWRYKWLKVTSISVIVWTTLACICLTIFACGYRDPWLWLTFTIGIPLQFLTLIFFLGWRKGSSHKKNKESE